MNLLKLFKRKEVYVCPDWVTKATFTSDWTLQARPRNPIVRFFQIRSILRAGNPYQFTGCTKEARKLIKEKPFKRSKLK